MGDRRKHQRPRPSSFGYGELQQQPNSYATPSPYFHVPAADTSSNWDRRTLQQQPNSYATASPPYHGPAAGTSSNWDGSTLQPDDVGREAERIRTERMRGRFLPIAARAPQEDPGKSDQVGIRIRSIGSGRLPEDYRRPRGHSETPGTPDHILLAEIERRGLESQNLRHRARRERERWEFGQLEQEIEKDAREQRQLERLERERWVNEISEHRERDRDLEELRRQFEETKLQAQMERDPQNKNILRGQESKEKERSQPIPIPSRGKNARAYYSPSLSDVSERETEYSKRGSSSRPAKISRRCDSCDGIDHGKMSEKKRGKGKV